MLLEVKQHLDEDRAKLAQEKEVLGDVAMAEDTKKQERLEKRALTLSRKQAGQQQQ